jgi:O-antigen/teichoic acid export membrane protein
MEVLIVLASVMTTLAIPVLAVSGTEDRDRFGKGLQLLLQGGLAVATAATLGLIAVAPALMTLIGGSDFSASGEVLRIQSLALLGVFANQALQFALVTLNQQRRLILANAVALATLLAAGVVLVRLDGPVGGATAVVIGEATLTAMLLIALARTDPGALPSPRFLLRLAVSAGAGAAVLLLPFGTWIHGIAAVLVFCAAAYVTQAVPRQVLHGVAGLRTPDDRGGAA